MALGALMTSLEKAIEELIHEKLIDHKKNFRTDPVALLLGPNEYISLMGSIQQRYKHRDGCIFPDTYFGIPVRVKKTNGIDLEIKFDEVFRFASG